MGLDADIRRFRDTAFEDQDLGTCDNPKAPPRNGASPLIPLVEEIIVPTALRSNGETVRGHQVIRFEQVATPSSPLSVAEVENIVEQIRGSWLLYNGIDVRRDWAERLVVPDPSSQGGCYTLVGWFKDRELACAISMVRGNSGGKFLNLKGDEYYSLMDHHDPAGDSLACFTVTTGQAAARNGVQTLKPMIEFVKDFAQHIGVKYVYAYSRSEAAYWQSELVFGGNREALTKRVSEISADNPQLDPTQNLILALTPAGDVSRFESRIQELYSAHDKYLEDAKRKAVEPSFINPLPGYDVFREHLLMTSLGGLAWEGGEKFRTALIEHVERGINVIGDRFQSRGHRALGAVLDGVKPFARLDDPMGMHTIVGMKYPVLS